MRISLRAPVAGAERDKLAELNAGDQVLLSGVIFTARDAAHARIVDVLVRGGEPPFPLRDAVIYYAGPTGESGGRPAGSIGPTTASRMDPFTEPLLDRGVAVVIGKGPRSSAVKEAFARNGAVYLAAVGGAGALLGTKIRSMELTAYPELGPEAVWRLEVVDMPLFVAYDLHGGDIFTRGEE